MFRTCDRPKPLACTTNRTSINCHRLCIVHNTCMDSCCGRYPFGYHPTRNISLPTKYSVSNEKNVPLRTQHWPLFSFENVSMSLAPKAFHHFRWKMYPNINGNPTKKRERFSTLKHYYISNDVAKHNPFGGYSNQSI